MERHLIKGYRLLTISSLLRPWVDYQKTRCSWVLMHRPSYNQVDLSFSSILGEKLNFKPMMRTCEHFNVYTRDKISPKLQRSPDWFWKLGINVFLVEFLSSFLFSFWKQANYTWTTPDPGGKWNEDKYNARRSFNMFKLCWIYASVCWNSKDFIFLFRR